MEKKGKKITVKESGAWRNGTFGDDTITVTAKKDACVFGNKGNDTITVKKGSNHKICGDDKGESYYYSTYSGKDTITLAGGSRNQVWGGKGADKIYVEKGAGFATICGCEGNDTITVYKGAKAGKKSDYANIDGGTGNNTITVTNGKYYDIDTEEGSDTIKINGGSYYKIEDTGGKKNVISIKNASNFEVYTYPESKGAITISGGKNGSVTTYKTTVTVNSGSSHRVTAEGTKVIINGGKNLTITDDDWRKTNEKVTINGGSGTVAMGDGGKETVTIDFGNGKNKVGNWHILADYLTNNRLTVLGASSTEFSFERKWEEPGPSLILNDRWIMTNNSTGATITLEGWYSNWTKTFDIYFEKDNKLISSVPAKAEVDKLNLH